MLGASIGLAAGLASGDVGKVAKFTAAGAYATGKLADNVATSVYNEGKNVVNDYKQGKANIDEQYAYSQRMKKFRKRKNKQEKKLWQHLEQQKILELA